MSATSPRHADPIPNSLPRPGLSGSGAHPAIIDGRFILAANRGDADGVACWRDVAGAFRRPAVRLVTINAEQTSELHYVPEAFSFGICPETFPAKIAALLYERYVAMHGDVRRGVVIRPEVITNQFGETLRQAALEHAQNWALPGAFGTWVRQANHFLDTPAE